MPRKDKGGAHKVTPKVPPDGGCPKFSNGRPLQDWAFEAYTLHVGRGQSVFSLAKKYKVKWEVVRRNIDAAHAAVTAANASDAVPALERHIARLLEVLKSTYQDYAQADNDKRPGFLRIILDTSEKLAAAEGVATKREQHEHNLNVGSFPVPVFSASDPLNHFAQAPAEAGGNDAAGDPGRDAA